jgi:group I intron endonuclease
MKRIKGGRGGIIVQAEKGETANPNGSGIYIITLNNSNSIYVGSAVNLNSRKSTHLSALKKNNHCNKKLQNCYNKYNDFMFNVLEFCKKEQLIEREQYYIDTLKPNLNILKIANSSLGYKHSLDTIKKMKIINKQISQRKEVIEIRSKTQFKKGCTIGDSHREKLKEIMTTNNPFKGKKHSEESKKTMSLKAKNRKNNNGKYLIRGLNAIKIEVEKNGIKTVFKSILEFEKHMNMNGRNGSLRRHLKLNGYYYFKKYKINIRYV